MCIRDRTKAQSNNSGTLLFPGNLFSGSSRVEVGGLNANIELQASDARIDNLDTLGSPLEILEAVMNKPYELNNTATFGVTDRPLRFGVKFLLSLMGDGKFYPYGYGFFYYSFSQSFFFLS